LLLHVELLVFVVMPVVACRQKPRMMKRMRLQPSGRV